MVADMGSEDYVIVTNQIWKEYMNKNTHNDNEENADNEYSDEKIAINI